MIKGYKVFNSDWTCNGYKYEMGRVFIEYNAVELSEKGFHFCLNLMDCFQYYNFDPSKKVAEVAALGKVIMNGKNCCTNKIKILKEIKWDEVLTLVNMGYRNSGMRNVGDHNGGNRNTGNGSYGSWNSGNRNLGSYNSGDMNSGYRNTGDKNSGYRNTGNMNYGHDNTGNFNFGNYNTGDFNISNHETGCFCTQEHTIKLFDKESDMTYFQWRKCKAYQIIKKLDESIKNAKNDGNSNKNGFLIWWEELNNEERLTIQGIPNFDAVKFSEITGIKII